MVQSFAHNIIVLEIQRIRELLPTDTDTLVIDYLKSIEATSKAQDTLFTNLFTAYTEEKDRADALDAHLDFIIEGT